MTNPFLKEAWERKARKEKGESRPEKHWEINLEDLENKIKAVKNQKAREELQEIFGRLKEDCYRYFSACQSSRNTSKESQGQFKFADREKHQSLLRRIELVDRRERSIHICIEDGLNILSRLFAKHGLDNKWRGCFSSYTQIGAWAFDMGKTE